MKQRIWELDALRGLCILGMVAVHFIYDLVDLYALVQWDYPTLFIFIRDQGSLLFFLLSGICVTLGNHHVRRGFLVFFCGILCTAVTYGMVAFGFAHSSMTIWFGVLHCLGACMLLWSLFRRFPVPVLVPMGLLMIAAGVYLNTSVLVDFPWLIPLGITTPTFASSDYFPIFPYLGYFLLGAVLGKTLYRRQQSLFPKVNSNSPIPAFLCACGKHSLWIYLLHQPVLAAFFTLISLL